MDHLKIFSSFTYVYVPQNQPIKLDSWSIICMLIGFDSTTKGYILSINPWIRKMVISKDVVMDELIQELCNKSYDLNMLNNVTWQYYCLHVTLIKHQDECQWDNHMKWKNCHWKIHHQSCMSSYKITNKATIVEELIPPTNVVNLEEYQQTSFLWFNRMHKPSRTFLKDFVFFIKMQEPSYVEVMSHVPWK